MSRQEQRQVLFAQTIKSEQLTRTFAVLVLKLQYDYFFDSIEFNLNIWNFICQATGTGTTTHHLLLNMKECSDLRKYSPQMQNWSPKKWSLIGYNYLLNDVEIKSKGHSWKFGKFSVWWALKQAWLAFMSSSVNFKWLLTFELWGVKSTLKCHVLPLNFSWNHPWPFLNPYPYYLFLSPL